MSIPSYSVVIPTLNEELYLPRLLVDLARQKFKDFEVVVVDADSIDNTRTIAEEFSGVLPMRIFRTKKRNVSYQRNYGASKSKGRFVVFLDADARIEPDFLFCAKNITDKFNARIVLPYLIPDRDILQINLSFGIANAIVYTSHMLGRPFSSGGSFVIEKKLFNLIGKFDENLFIAEDHELIQRAYHLGYKPSISQKLKITFSLRRMDKEGQLLFLYKYIKAARHVFLKDKIIEKIFDYEMGGQEYYFFTKYKIIQEVKEYSNEMKYKLKSVMLYEVNSSTITQLVDSLPPYIRQTQKKARSLSGIGYLRIFCIASLIFGLSLGLILFRNNHSRNILSVSMSEYTNYSKLLLAKLVDL